MEARCKQGLPPQPGLGLPPQLLLPAPAALLRAAPICAKLRQAAASGHAASARALASHALRASGVGPPAGCRNPSRSALHSAADSMLAPGAACGQVVGTGCWEGLSAWPI